LQVGDDIPELVAELRLRNDRIRRLERIFLFLSAGD
jgi:hypothetical protein